MSERADALARVLNFVEGRFDIDPEQVQNDVRTLHTMWLEMHLKENR